MSFLTEMRSRLAFDEGIAGTLFAVADFHGMVVQGHKGISKFSAEEIVINLKHGKLKITGENLRFLEINKDEIFLEGEIKGLWKE